MDSHYPARQSRLRHHKEAALVVELSADEDERAAHTQDWNPGRLSRFPWLGAGSLMGVLVCVALAITTLLVSDGRSQSKWPKWIAPNVILSGINTVSNVFLAIAIGNGVAVAWWRKALQAASIAQLHESWSFSKSMLEIAKAGRRFNTIALATLIAKFAFVDSLLMQSATSTEILPEQPRFIQTTGFANETWPFTGRVIGASGQPGSFTTWFQADLLTWTRNPATFALKTVNQRTIDQQKQFHECNGTCVLSVPAIGFQFDCENAVLTSIAFNTSSNPLYKNGTLRTQALFDLGFRLQWNPFNMFPNMPSGPPATITMTTMYTESHNIVGDSSCTGSSYKQTCVLRPSIIKYPVVVSSANTQNGDGVSTITLSSGNSRPFNAIHKQQDGFDFVKHIEIRETHALGGQGDLSQLAGLAQAFTMFLGGSSGVSFDGRYNWIISQDGNAARYMLNQPSVEECNWRYADPLLPVASTSGFTIDSVITSINQIMFALAIDISGSDPNNIGTMRSFQATMYSEGIHYKTKIWYMIGAAISTLLVVICVLPVYYGYWELGRKVTLGPVEIAHAFRSPMTAQATSGRIDGLVKEIGQTEVQFGHIVAGDAKGVLGIAEPQYVARL